MNAVLPRPPYLTRILGVALTLVFAATVAKSVDVVDIGGGTLDYPDLDSAFADIFLNPDSNLILYGDDSSIRNRAIATGTLTNIGITSSDGTMRILKQRVTASNPSVGGIFTIAADTTPFHLYLENLTIADSVVNGTQSRGGAIYSGARDLDFTNSRNVIFSGNIARKTTTTTSTTNSTNHGGAIYAGGALSFRGVENIAFNDNLADGRSDPSTGVAVVKRYSGQGGAIYGSG
ncbi:MAG: hypothetical protein LBU79_08190, partial [Planctomycetota bacterium]|nr:hypothetical protein [Planctomycetota bacterium]